MGSQSLAALSIAIHEISLLQQVNPSPFGAQPSRPDITRAIGRASVVLLSSHFERYFYAINEEAVGVVNSCGVTGLCPWP